MDDVLTAAPANSTPPAPATERGSRAADAAVLSAWSLAIIITSGLAILVLLDRLAVAGWFAAIPPLEPGAEASPRLAGPLGYWNALGAWCAVALVLLTLAAGHVARRPVAALCGAAMPLVLAAAYLTYSRGAILSALIGLAAALWLAPRRAQSVAFVSALLLPSLAAVGVVALDEGVALARDSAARGLPPCWDSPSSAARQPGSGASRRAAWRSGKPSGSGCATRSRRGASAPSLARARPSDRAGVRCCRAPRRRRRRRAAPGVHRGVPADDRCPQPPRDLSSNGRAQLWRAAWDAWRAQPGGTGRDTFRFSFDREAPIGFTARDAHNLYLERLSERGPAGLLALLALIAAGAAALLVSRRAARRSAPAAGLVAATTGGLTALLAGAAVDWYLEIPALCALSLGLLAAGMVPWAYGRRAQALAGLAAAAALSGFAAWQFVPAPSVRAVEASQRAVRAGDLRAAAREADRAIAADRASTAGFVQAALVAEQRGELRVAASRLAQARALISDDWRTWALTARVEAEAGRPAQAWAAFNRGARARPGGMLFLGFNGPRSVGAAERACRSDTAVEEEHCERLPRADGGWELVNDPRQPGAAPLPLVTAERLREWTFSPNPACASEQGRWRRSLVARPVRR